MKRWTTDLNEALDDIMERTGRPATRAERFALGKPILRRVDWSSDDPGQRFAMAEVHFRNFQPDPAAAYYRPLMARDDDIARLSVLRMIQMEQIAYGNAEGAELLIEDFRGRFREFHPGDWLGLARAYANKATTLHRAGRASDAAAVLLDHVQRAPFDAPYASHRLVASNLPIFRDAGMSVEAAQVLTRTIEQLSLLRTDPPQTIPALDLPSEVLLIHRHFDEDGFFADRYEATRRRLDIIITANREALARLEVGDFAPDEDMNRLTIGAY